MNQTLQTFIDRKRIELHKQYRVVELVSHISVELKGRTVGEKYVATNTPLETTGHEVTVEQFPPNSDTDASFVENGSHVKFDVVAKGKRKPERKEFYFLWDAEK